MSLETLMTFGVALAAIVALLLIRLSIRQQLLETHVARIDRLLTAWAKGWGQPPEKVREELIRILSEGPSSAAVRAATQPSGSPSDPLAMGSDFGVSLVILLLCRALR